MRILAAVTADRAVLHLVLHIFAAVAAARGCFASLLHFGWF